MLESIKPYNQLQDFIFPAPRSGAMLFDMSLTTLIKRMHEQKLNENGLGYIDPKQNRVIRLQHMVSDPCFVIGLLIKRIIHAKFVSMC